MLYGFGANAKQSFAAEAFWSATTVPKQESLTVTLAPGKGAAQFEFPHRRTIICAMTQDLFRADAYLAECTAAVTAITEGAELTAKITKIAEFGAFAEIGRVDDGLHLLITPPALSCMIWR